MASQTPTGRAIVVAVDPLVEASVQVVQYVGHELARPGDTIHLCHVARIMSPTLTIQHGREIPGGMAALEERRGSSW